MKLPGRNDPCHCGSGKKYKNCCLAKDASQPRSTAPSAAAGSKQIKAALANAAALVDAGRIQEAIALCQRLLQVAPDNTEALNLLGILAYQTGNDDAAIHLLARAVAVNPGYADAHSNLGAVYRDMHRFSQAAMHLKKAITLNPRHTDAMINYGIVLLELGQHTDAISLFKRILAIRPDHTGVLNNLGGALQETGQYDLAMQTFQRLVDIDPDYEFALGSLLHAKRHCCTWERSEQDLARIMTGIEAGKPVCKPFELLAFLDSPGHQRDCANIITRHKYPSQHAGVPSPKARGADGKIRIAYLSADFRQHPVSQLLVEIIEKHDRSRFDVIGISWGIPDESALGKRISLAFDQFIDVRDKGDKDVADMMGQMQVDIAIDLMGFTTNARPGIFSWKRVPLQAGFLGYAGTSGSDYMDFILADRIVIPESAKTFYSEQVVYLPGSFQPNDSTRSIADQAMTRAEAGLPEDGYVFCSFNNHYKITPEMYALWMRLLARTPDSVLWLSKCPELAMSNLRQHAENAGIAPERIVFAERTRELKEHLARHHLADLFLDTLPYNAHTTASDALWAGLPVLTCQGRSYASSVAASLLHAVGLPELIVHTLEDYEALALSLAGDRQKCQALRRKLREIRDKAVLFDTATYLAQYEDTLINITCQLQPTS